MQIDRTVPSATSRFSAVTGSESGERLAPAELRYAASGSARRTRLESNAVSLSIGFDRYLSSLHRRAASPDPDGPTSRELADWARRLDPSTDASLKAFICAMLSDDPQRGVGGERYGTLRATAWFTAYLQSRGGAAEGIARVNERLLSLAVDARSSGQGSILDVSTLRTLLDSPNMGRSAAARWLRERLAVGDRSCG